MDDHHFIYITKMKTRIMLVQSLQVVIPTHVLAPYLAFKDDGKNAKLLLEESTTMTGEESGREGWG